MEDPKMYSPRRIFNLNPIFHQNTINAELMKITRLIKGVEEPTPQVAKYLEFNSYWSESHAAKLNHLMDLRNQMYMVKSKGQAYFHLIYNQYIEVFDCHLDSLPSNRAFYKSVSQYPTSYKYNAEECEIGCLVEIDGLRTPLRILSQFWMKEDTNINEENESTQNQIDYKKLKSKLLRNVKFNRKNRLIDLKIANLNNHSTVSSSKACISLSCQTAQDLLLSAYQMLSASPKFKPRLNEINFNYEFALKILISIENRAFSNHLTISRKYKVVIAMYYSSHLSLANCGELLDLQGSSIRKIREKLHLIGKIPVYDSEKNKCFWVSKLKMGDLLSQSRNNLTFYRYTGKKMKFL